ncbi:hypothetical protein PsYK624_153440 [Phanerochaete sordida]|uniref:Uncharacterized protein n=1 Tax=Phanerochaete sordida TaxID=48140 RepID=A0A9P3GQ88_9APHY|nr:hypothetical protein PsYK624_153440 [Phanerochaete sordida]
MNAGSAGFVAYRRVETKRKAPTWFGAEGVMSADDKHHTRADPPWQRATSTDATCRSVPKWARLDGLQERGWALGDESESKRCI